MEAQKSMIIIGAAGSGKSRRAQAEAEKRGGNYVVTTWADLQGKFGLALLDSGPATVIVEELPSAALGKASSRAFLKQLASGDDLLIDVKYKNPRTVPAPMFIFTILTPPKPDLSLVSAEWRRFEVVEV